MAIHISARKPSQRWTVGQFAQAMQRLHAAHGAHFILFWSPGAADNPHHPGDDDKADALLRLLGDAVPVVAARTRTLPELIQALAECHAMVCGDGGASHLAAGLGLPIVCLFGNSDAARWRPWGVPYRQIRSPSLNVADIDVADVVAAFNELRASIPAPNAATRA